MLNYYKIKKDNRGLTLLEMMVAVTIFSVVILSATQIFKMVVEGQRNALTAENIQENMRYAFEAMSKEMRMAQRSDTSCEPTGIYKVFNLTGGNTELHFRNKDGLCVKYYMSNNRLKIDRGADVGYDITPNEIKINSLVFNVTDEQISSPTHSIQAIATITVDAEAVNSSLHKQNMKIQMTVSSRHYE